MTPTDLQALVAELEELEKKATPGPVYVQQDGTFPGKDVRRIVARGAIDDRIRQECSAQPAYLATIYSPNEAALYAATRNALPHLLAHLREQTERAEAAEARVRKLEGAYREVRDQCTEAMRDASDAEAEITQLRARVEADRKALEKAKALIACNRLMLGEYSGVRYVMEVEADIDRALSAHQPAAAGMVQVIEKWHFGADGKVDEHTVEPLEPSAAVGSCVERRVFEGRVTSVGWEGWILKSGDSRFSEWQWFDGLEGKRVRLVVEVLPDEPAAACRYQTWLDSDEDQASGPTCGKRATHRACSPKGEPRCAEHKCRCDLPLADEPKEGR